MNKMIFKNAAGFGWGFILGFNVLRLMGPKKPEAEKKPTTEKPIEISATNEPAEPINETPKNQTAEPVNEPVPTEKIIDFTAEPVFVGETDAPDFPVIPDSEYIDLHRWTNFGRYYRFLAASGIFISVSAIGYFYLRIRGLIAQHYREPTYWTNLAVEIRNFIRQNRPVSYPNNDPEARSDLLKKIGQIEKLDTMAGKIENQAQNLEGRPVNLPKPPSRFIFEETLNMGPQIIEKKEISQSTLYDEFEDFSEGEEVIIFGENNVKLPEILQIEPNEVKIEEKIETRTIEVGNQEYEIQIFSNQKTGNKPTKKPAKKSDKNSPYNEDYGKEEKPEEEIVPEIRLNTGLIGNSGIFEISRRFLGSYGNVLERSIEYGRLILRAREIIKNPKTRYMAELVKIMKEISIMAKSDLGEFSGGIRQFFSENSQILGTEPQENYISLPERFQIHLSGAGGTNALNFSDLASGTEINLAQIILDRLIEDNAFFIITDDGEIISGFNNIYEYMNSQNLILPDVNYYLARFFISRNPFYLQKAFAEIKKKNIGPGLVSSMPIIGPVQISTLRFSSILLRAILSYQSIYNDYGIRIIRSITQAKTQLNLHMLAIYNRDSLLLETMLYDAKRSRYRITGLQNITVRNFEKIAQLIKILIDFLKSNSGLLSSDLFRSIYSTISELFSQYDTEIGGTRQALLQQFGDIKYVEANFENVDIVQKLRNLKGSKNAVNAYLHALVLLGYPISIDENSKAEILNIYSGKQKITKKIGPLPKNLKGKEMEEYLKKSGFFNEPSNPPQGDII